MNKARLVLYAAATVALAVYAIPAKADLVLFNNGTGFGGCTTDNCKSFQDMSGTGFGALPRVLTMQTTGTEIGSVTPGPTVNGDAISGADKASTPSLQGLGWNNGSQVGIAFVIDQTGQSDITLNSLSLSVYTSAGTLLHTFSTAPGTDLYTHTELALQPGNGNAAFVYVLDAAQQAFWNSQNFALADIVGLGASLSGANDGPDSFALLAQPGSPLNPVPLPGAAWLFGTGLAGIMLVGRKRKQKTSMA